MGEEGWEGKRRTTLSKLFTFLTCLHANIVDVFLSFRLTSRREGKGEGQGREKGGRKEGEEGR